MATKIDTTLLTFTAEQVRAIGDMTFDAFIKAPEVQATCVIHDNVVFNREVAFFGVGGIVGSAAQGCNPTYDSYVVGTRKITWEPAEWQVPLALCYKDLDNTLGVYSRKTGIAIADMVDTDYMNVIVMALTESLKEFFIRVIWFGDKLIENITDSGVLVDTCDVKYFNLIDGLFKQMDTQVTANPAQGVNVAENEGVSKVAQAMVVANVQGYLSKLIFNAPLELRGMANNFILCTQTIYDAYYQSLLSDKITPMYQNILDGVEALTYLGVPIIPMPLWDRLIKTYFDQGATYLNPNRALYTNQEVLGVAVDSLSSLGEIDVNYDKKSKLVLIDAGGMLDAKLQNPSLFTYAV